MKKCDLGVAAACAAAVLGLSAETLTWTGAATGTASTNFLAAANWSPSQAPKGGDTLIMAKEVTLAPCEFDFGSAGLTISNSAKVVSKTTFKGSGKLVKDGAGRFQNDYVCKHTGGTLILDGELYQNARYENNKDGTQTKYPLGTGQIEIRRSATTAPLLNLQNYCYVHSSILVSGPYTASQRSFFENNNPNVYGLITAEDDFLAYCSWSNGSAAGAGFRGGISAHGHTAHIANSGSGYATTLAGDIDASLETSKGEVYIANGGGSDPTATLTVKAGNCRFKPDGYWRGKTIKVAESGALLSLAHPDNLTPDAEIEIVSGGKLEFATAFAVQVTKLTVAGVEKPVGIYSKANLNGVITGDGCLYVGDVFAPHDPQRIAWTGSAGDFKWNNAANWSPQLVPTTGDTAFFSSSHTVTQDSNRPVEPVYLPEGTLTLEVDYGDANNYGFHSYVAFSGPAKIVKTGSGSWISRKTCAYTGGTEVENGTISLGASHAFGSGDITIKAENGKKPYFRGLPWGPTFTNKVVIVGDASSYTVLTVSNALDVQGPIVSESDFTVGTSYGPLSLSGGVSAPGHTMTYNGASSYHDYDSRLSGTYDVALSVKGAYQRSFSCQGVGVDHALSFTAGTNMLDSTFSWKGTNVVVSGAKTLVTLGGNANLSPDAELRVSGGAKIAFDGAKLLNVRRLFDGSQEVASGVYAASDLPNVFKAGTTGKVCVGQAVCLWTGNGVSGEWSDPDNWLPRRVPQGGDTAYIASAVTITNRAGAVSIDGDLVVENTMDVTWSVVLTGTGKLVKRGSGKFAILLTKLQHTGGVSIEQGVLQMDQKSALGTGPVWIVRTETVKPQFDLSKAGTSLVLTNDFYILGPKSTNWDIQNNNDNQFNGKVVAEDDFWITTCWSNNKYNGTVFNATIDAPGHTAKFTNFGWFLNGKSNASIEFATANEWNCTLGAKFEGTDPDATLTTVAKTFFQDGAKWPGRLDVETASGKTPGTVSIPAKTKIRVGSLVIGGVTQPSGLYRKTSAPAGSTPGDTFVGDGTLAVGTPGMVLQVR